MQLFAIDKKQRWAARRYPAIILFINMEVQSTSPFTPSNRIFVTGTIFLAYFVYGISFFMINPARKDIADLIQVDLPHVTYGSTVRAVGYCIGSIILGLLFRRFNRNGGASICFLVIGIVMLVTTHAGILWTYLMLETLMGFFSAGIDVVCIPWLMDMWSGQNVNPLVQGLFFAFALGMTSSPLLVEPFLTVSSSETTSVNNTTFSTNSTASHSKTMITIPYTISGVSLLVCAAGVVALSFFIPYISRGNTNDKEEESDTKSTQRYTLIVILLGSLFFFCEMCVHTTTMTFIPEFASAIPLKFSKSKAAFVTSLMSGSFATCLGISIFVATKVNANTMLVSACLVRLVGNVMLLLFASKSELCFYASVVILGAGESCVSPCFMTLMRQRIKITSFVYGILMLASWTPSIPVSMIIGNFIQSIPYTYVYINLVGLAACLLAYVTLIIVDRLMD